MFYRIKDNKVFDYAEFKYVSDALKTDVITTEEYRIAPNKVLVEWVDVTEVIEIKPPVYDEETGELIEKGEYENVVVKELIEVEPAIINEKTGEIITPAVYEERNKQRQELVLNPNYEQEQAQKERERISKLFLTAADVERSIYKATGKDFNDVVAMVEQVIANDSEAIQIDIKALKIELKANNFYRGNPYISQMGALLGLTEKQLDEFFETGDYTKLIIREE